MYSIIYNFLLEKNIVTYKIKCIRGYSRVQNIWNIIENMPRETLHTKQARISYENRKKNIGKYQSNAAKIEVIGSGAHATPSSVNIFSENSRYLFNCGEGTQRISSEWKVKIFRVPRVFITYPSWKNIGGLIGFCLTVESTGVPEIFIHGHSSIENLFCGTNKFVNFRRLKITVKECKPETEFSDGIFNIKYVNLYPANSKKLVTSLSESKVAESEVNVNEVTSFESDEEYKDETSNDEDEVYHYDHIKRSRLESGILTKKGNLKKRSHSEACKSSNYSEEKFAISYICQTQKTKGKLLIDKCIDLGLHPGPLLGKLKSGEDIVLDNGKIIKGSDVTSPDVPGAIIIVVECPTEDYLDSLLQEPAFFKHQTGEINPSDIAELVVHFTDSKIMKHPKYKEWMNRFPKATKHLLINEDNESLGSWGVYRHQYSLNQLHPEIFPLLYPTSPPFVNKIESNTTEEHTVVKKGYENEETEDVCKKEENPEEEINENLEEKVFYKCNKNSVIKGETFCQVYIRPIKHYDFSYPLPLKEGDVLEKILSTKGLKEELEKLKNKLKEIEALVKLDKREYPKILFLGTGSSIPNKKRNTSGILVFLDENNAMVLDCGEGTYGQLVRFFGKKKAKEVLRKINIIYVSHLHVDHHIGLFTILRERKAAFEEINYSNSKELVSHSNTNETITEYNKPLVFAPAQMLRWLTTFSEKLEKISDLYDFVPNQFPPKCNSTYLGIKSRALQISKIKDIKTTLVDHCPNAFGVALIHNEGWKLTYSGDTKPCKSLIELGRNSDVLIHEATMSDSLEQEAAQKLHSTISQAIEVGKNMNAKFILLTHFSQRYSHLPVINQTLSSNIGIAFDNMMVSMNQLPLLPLFYDTLKFMFSEHYEKTEQKIIYSNKRKRKALSSPERPSKISEKLQSLL